MSRRGVHECDTQAFRRRDRHRPNASERGIERGEVRPVALDGYVLHAIPMMMCRSKVCGCERQVREVEEMSYQLMGPLLWSHGS